MSSIRGALRQLTRSACLASASVGLVPTWRAIAGPSPLTFVRTATKRAAGSRTSMKDSAGRRLGMKRTDGQPVKAGEIIYRQRGTRFYPGENTDIGKDHTIWAKEPGFVRFYYDPFHPKRRLIGVALSAKDQLPTPHFEPRKRRLGFVPIDNAKVAEEEKQRLSRKESLRLPGVLQELEKREQARSKRISDLKESLSAFVSGLSEAELQQSASRLVVVSNYLAGGRDMAESRRFTDSAFVQDTKLSAEQGRIDASEAEHLISEYQRLASTVDAAVSFDADRKLCAFFTEEQLESLRKESLLKLDELTADAPLPLADDIKEQVLAVLRQPCFDLSDRNYLRRKYVRAAPPEIIQDKDALNRVEKLEKQGKGKIVKSWNYAKRKVDTFFLPAGTSMFAIR